MGSGEERTRRLLLPSYFVLGTPDGDGLGDYPTFGLSDGRAAVCIFSTADKAELVLQFMKSLPGPEINYRVIEMRLPALLRWLGGAMRKGVWFVDLDRAPVSCEYEQLEILQFLASAE